MKDKIYESYKNNDWKKYNKIIDNLSKNYHDENSFRIVDLCSDFGITCGLQKLDGDATSYAAFNATFNNRFHNDKFIIVESNLSLKEKRMHYAYHFFQYALNSYKENYEVAYNFYKNKKYYDNALNLLLPKKRLLKDYKWLMDLYGKENLVLLELSDKYLVPYEDVEKRIINIVMKKDKKRFSKKIKR